MNREVDPVNILYFNLTLYLKKILKGKSILQSVFDLDLILHPIQLYQRSYIQNLI